MADQDTQVADAPEQAAEAPDTSQDTKPTPVREGMPSSRSEVREQGLEATMAALEEKYGGGEEPPETDEAAAEGQEAPEGEPAPEVAAEDAVRMDQGPDAADLPEGYQYDEHGRLHDEAGRYVSPAQLEPSEDGAAASGEEVPHAGEDPDAPSVPEGFETLDLPPGHPLRDRGEEQVPIPSKDALVEQFGERGEQVYNYLRHGLNAGAENRQLRTQFQQLQNRLARLEAEREVEQSEDAKRLDPEHNAEIRTLLDDVRETYGEEQAQLIEQALTQSREKMTEEKSRERLSERQQQQVAARFVGTVANRANEMYDAWPGFVATDPQTGRLVGQGERYQRIATALQQYAQLVDAGGARPDPENFFRHLDALYIQDPRAQRQVKERLEEMQSEQQSKAKQEATEERKREERERLKEAAEKRDNNPHAKLGSQKTGKSSPEPDEEPPDYKGMSKGRMMDDIKKRIGLA